MSTRTRGALESRPGKNVRTLDDLDQIDRKILEILQCDGRIANADLAKLIKLSPTPTLDRTRRLEREGFVEKYVAVLNSERMGSALVAFIEVELDRTTEDVREKFARAVRDTREIIECHLVGGGFDYMLKVRVQDMAAYRRFMGLGLAALPNVRAVHTYHVIESVKVAAAFITV